MPLKGQERISALNGDFCHMPNYSRITIICLILTVLTIGAFWQLKDNGFIRYDDDSYITKNLQVQGGLSLSGFLWAFSNTDADNWHPLTWLSHMLDCQLYGLNPRGHHLTSLFFHLVNTLLLFWVWVRLPKGSGPAPWWPASLRCTRCTRNQWRGLQSARTF